jgi:2,4-dienoyl-CoA reductase-like NADH-dependent reductase (Old Yellow Enzyme family)
MALDVSPLFRPFTLGSLTLANRIVMAPMTRSFSPGGVPGVNVAQYYRRRAERAVGLIVTEGTVVAHPAAANDPAVPRFHGEDALAGWKTVVDEVHAAGGKIMPQLWHVGILRRVGSEPDPSVPPIAPSGVSRPGKKVVEPMSERDIADVIAAFARGASDAMRLGFDGIEIHGAHGYLIDQFFWEATNVRDDRYGGDMVRRTTFAAEIVQACRKATRPDFPIILRFSQWKQQDYAARLAPTPLELERFLAPLSAAGVDIFHCSTRRFWQPEFDGSEMNLAGWTRKLTGKPVITVGSVGLDTDFITSFMPGKNAGLSGQNLERLIEMLARGEVDLVAVGRALLSDPDWVLKLRDGRSGEMKAYTAEALKSLS